jgi:hypothetical protein
LDLVRAFTCIEDAKLRRAIVRLVEQIAPDDDRRDMVVISLSRSGGLPAVVDEP